LGTSIYALIVKALHQRETLPRHKRCDTRDEPRADSGRISALCPAVFDHARKAFAGFTRQSTLGVLTVKLPKKPEAQKPTKKIEVKAT